MPQENNIKRKFSTYFYNSITYIGIVLTLILFTTECILFVIDFINPNDNIYLAIITYIVLPAFFLFGIALIPFGAFLKRRKISRGVDTSPLKPFKIDPSLATHRNAIFTFLIGATILLVMTAIGSYKAFHYTESVHFCGEVCHKVMKPEYNTYLQSPHARVKCVDCHIGYGANWYVKSKLSGLRQVFKTIINKYPKPIPTPVHNLRPSKGTCEQCHWPGKFFTSVEMRRTYFPLEESEYPSWFLRMLINVGQNEMKNGSGIHSHMYIDNEIYYASEDERRQEISWVKSVDSAGAEKIYITPDSIYKDSPPPEEKIRKMDCIDCHNRPSHHFYAPSILVDDAMLRKNINPDLPSIKMKAVEVLSREYSSSQEAEESIRTTLSEFYTDKYKAGYSEHKEKIDQTIEQVILIYQNNIFPEMKARWDAFPDNIGHMNSAGCFRCHNNEHTSSDGKVISQDCKSCHTIIEQGPPGLLEKSTDGLEFRHPFQEHDMWKEISCHECHSEL